MFTITGGTSGGPASTRSTSRTARSVSARLAPSGVSTVTRNCGRPALGKRLKPMAGTSATLAGEERRAATSVTRGRARAPVQHRPVGSIAQVSRAEERLPCSRSP